jgi:hypothetical protein
MMPALCLIKAFRSVTDVLFTPSPNVGALAVREERSTRSEMGERLLIEITSPFLARCIARHII